MRNLAILLIVVMLTACGGPSAKPTQQAPEPDDTPGATSRITAPQDPPVEFGKRPPNMPMTSDNMPFFDRVTYCELTTRKMDKIYKGPAYEACVEDQAHYRAVIAEAINVGQFKEADVMRCAKASRTAYQGMWFCLNGQEF